MKYPIIGAVALSALLPAAALAQTAGMVTTDLNVRQGPGSNYPVVATVAEGGSVTVVGCIENSAWCEVEAGGKEGYAFGRYIMADADGTRVGVTERPGIVGLVTAPVSTATGTLGTIAGAFTDGGSAGQGVEAGRSTTFAERNNNEPALGSPEFVVKYVRENPSSDQVFLDGEAVPGAIVPATVDLKQVPDTEYAYANINGDEVVVEGSTRTVLYVVR